MKVTGFTMKYKKIMAIGMLASFGLSMMGTAHAADIEGDMSTSKITESIQNNDYESFIEVLSRLDADAADNMTEDIFNEIVENYNERDNIQHTIDNLDYAAWVELMSQTPGGESLTELISEEEFELYAEMMQAKQDGDYRTAKEIAHEIGLDELRTQNPDLERPEPTFEHSFERPEAVFEHVTVPSTTPVWEEDPTKMAKKAIMKGDYEAWLQAIENSPSSEVLEQSVSEEDFEDLQKFEELKESGENERARDLAKDLSLPFSRVIPDTWERVTNFFR